MLKKKPITSKNYNLYLDDILEAIQKIESYTVSLTFEDFSKNSMATDAVIRNLEIIGEAAKNIPPEMRGNYPSVEWKKIAGFRDIIVHAYWNVSLPIIWEIVKVKIPELKIALERKS